MRQLPDQLRELLPGKLPRNVKLAVLEALAEGTPADRTPEQLVRYRVSPKWWGHYSGLHQAGELEKPVGAFIQMLKRDKECGNDRCDERVDVDTTEPCKFCATAKEDRKAARIRAAADVPQAAPSVEGGTLPECRWSREPGSYPDAPGRDEGKPPFRAAPEVPLPEQGGRGMDDFTAARERMLATKGERYRRLNRL